MGKKKNAPKTPKRRNVQVQKMIDRGGAGAGYHKDQDRDYAKGRSRKQKHKKRPLEASELTDMAARLAKRWVQHIPEKHKPDNREISQAESSSQHIPEPPAGLKDPKEREG